MCHTLLITATCQTPETVEDLELWSSGQQSVCQIKIGIQLVTSSFIFWLIYLVRLAFWAIDLQDLEEKLLKVI